MEMEVSDTENILARMCYWKVLDFTYITHLEVEKEYRRHGIAQSIVESLEGKLCLEVDVDNSAALALYLKCGFRILGRMPMYYGETDAYYMERGDKPIGDGTGLENRRA